jgi:hypothetical protein
MKLNYSPKDWQLLSNYLDGQLTNREVSIVETRLKSEPQLKHTLMEMQQTRYLLQHAKKVPVPRSFTLTPEMAAQIRPARKPLFPFFSFASVIATIFLVIVILFEFLPGMLSGVMSQKSAASNEMLAMEAAPMAEEALDSATPPLIIEWGRPAGAYGMGGGGGDAGMLAAPPVGGGNEMEPEMPEMPAEEPAPAAEEERSVTKQADSEPITGAGPILGIRSAEETDAFNNSVLNILRESGNEPIPTLSEPFPWLRVSQIFLGSIAIIFAITAIILRKRSF